MMPVRRTQSWLPSIFNDFFDNDWMVKENAVSYTHLRAHET